MDEQRFSDEMGPVLDALRDERGTCSEIEEMLRADPGTLDRDDRLIIARHLEFCPKCAAKTEPVETDVDDLSWRRVSQGLDRRPRPWLATDRGARGGRFRRPVLIAATLVIALAAATIWRQSQPDPDLQGSISNQRGASIQTMDPSGPIDRLTEFSWRTVLPIELTFKIELSSGDTLLWQGETTRDSLAPPTSVTTGLEPGKRYRWRVLGLDQSRVIAESTWTEFELEP